MLPIFFGGFPNKRRSTIRRAANRFEISDSLRNGFCNGACFCACIYYICIFACFCARGDRSRRRGGHLLSPLSCLWPSDDDQTSRFGTIQICFHYSWNMCAHSKYDTGSVNLSEFFNSSYGVARPSSCPMLCPYFQNCRKIKYRSPKESIEWFKEMSQPPPSFSKKTTVSQSYAAG